MNTERHIKGAGVAAIDQGGRSGEVILIPKQLRAEWMDLMGLDPSLAPSAKAVALVIGAHFNRHRGNAFLRQDTIGRHAGLSVRSVQLGIAELELRGYLIVERRELHRRDGAATRDGRRKFGGKGVANTYLPAMAGVQITATSAGRRLGERVEALIEAERVRIAQLKAAAGCVHSADNGRSGLRPLDELRPQNQTAMAAAGCGPTLTHPSDENPCARERAGARGVAPAHPLARCEPALIGWLGEGVVRTWFADASIERLERDAGGTLVLGTPNAFNRDWIASHFTDALRSCWNRSVPASDRVERVEIVVRK